MSEGKSTATIAVSKPAKKAKDPKLTAMRAKFVAASDALVEANAHIRQLEGQKAAAERKAVSDSQDTRRVANAMLVIEMLTDMSEGDKDIPASHLGRIGKQLTKDFADAAKMIGSDT